MQCKLRWFLHEVDPDLDIPSRALRRYHLLEELQDTIADRPGVVAEICRDLLVDITTLTHRIAALEARLSQLVHACGPTLLQVPGLA